MKQKSLRNIGKQFICWILFIQMVNISIDPPDLVNFKNGNTSCKEDLTINEMESIYELVSETLFNNDVPESDEKDPDKYHHTFDLYCFSLIDSENIFSAFPIQHSEHYQEGCLAHYTEPNFPPPKQA